MDASSWVAICASGLSLAGAIVAVILKITDLKKAKSARDNALASMNCDASTCLEAVNLINQLEDLLSKECGDEYLSNAQENLNIAKANITQRLTEITSVPE